MKWLELFDAANACDCYKRTTSIMPQQALALSNSELAIRAAKTLAAKIWSATGDQNRFVAAVFEQVLSRRATDAEQKLAAEFLTKQRQLFEERKNEIAGDSAARARENLVHALFNHNDFVTIR